MSNPNLPEGKSRYTLTLSDDNVSWFHDYLKKNRRPKGLFSAMIDEYLDDLRKAITDLEKRQGENGKISLGDLFSVTGKILDEKENPALPLNKC